VARLGVYDQVMCSFPSRGQDCFFFTALGLVRGPHSLLFNGFQGLSLGWTGHESILSSYFSTEAKKPGGFIFNFLYEVTPW
jgi:hypothetical protein